MAPPRNPDSGHRTFSQSKQVWDLTALLWGKTETGLLSRSLPIPFAYGAAQPCRSLPLRPSDFLGSSWGVGQTSPQAFRPLRRAGQTSPNSPTMGRTCLPHPPRWAQEVAERAGLVCPTPQEGPKKWPKGLDLFAPPPELADRPVDLFAPPPKVGPRSGRKAWTCLPHPPKRAQEVAERPGLVCPPRSGLVCPPPKKGPRSGRKAWTSLPRPPTWSQEVAERPGLDCPAPQDRPKKWRKGLDLFSPPPKMALRSGRKAWTCLPRPPRWAQEVAERPGLVCPAPQNGLDLSKMDPRSGRKVCAHSMCLWHRPTTPLQDAPLQHKFAGLLLFLPP